jgi:hypothetical protein
MLDLFTLSREGSLEGFRLRRVLPSLTISCLCRYWALARPLYPAAESSRIHSSSGLCGLRFPPFSSLSSLRSRALSGPHFSLNFLRLSPFPVYPEPRRATLASHLQLAENKTTLSPAVATLTSRVKHNPFVCHSYKKHPGWGLHLSSQMFFASGCCSWPSPVTNHQSQVTKSCRIRTSAKLTHNPFRIRTSKTRHLKSFRICTYKKTRRGAGCL